MTTPIDKVLSVLVHGSSKAGKSTLGSTAPPPILVLDAEGSWKFIHTAGFRTGAPLRRVEWNPMTGPPPRYDGTWDLCVVPVTDWQTVRQIYAWLSQQPHDFASVILDSITELQRRCKTAISADSVLRGYDGWGQLLADMDRVIRGYRDLTLLRPGPVRCVLLVAETRQEGAKWRPYMQGQISTSLPYWVDICGYQYRQAGLLPDGSVGPEQAHLWIGASPMFESGERVQGVLPADIVDPNLTEMIEQVYAPFTITITTPQLAVASAAPTEGTQHG